MQSTYRVNNQAFSMIEMAIVLIVISIALGFGLNFLSNKTDNDKIKATQNKIELISNALNSYVAEKRSIPCPAWPSLNETNVNFGVAARNSVLGDLCDQDPSFSGLRSNGVVWGSIPVANLELDNNYAFDSWGNKFSYIMVETCNTNLNHASCGTNANNQIIINDSSGASIINDAILLIMSHGKNGYGAFQITGNNRNKGRSLIGSNERDNAHLNEADGVSIAPSINNNFISQSINLSTNSNNYFDDILHFKNKAQLLEDIKALNFNEDRSCAIITAFQLGYISANDLCGSRTTPSCQNIMDNLRLNLNNFCY